MFLHERKGSGLNDEKNRQTQITTTGDRPSLIDQMRPHARTTGRIAIAAGKGTWDWILKPAGKTVAAVTVFGARVIHALAAEIGLPMAKAVFAPDAPKPMKAFKWTAIGAMAIGIYGFARPATHKHKPRPVQQDPVGYAMPRIDINGSAAINSAANLFDAFFSAASRDQTISQGAPDHMRRLYSYLGKGKSNDPQLVNAYINNNMGANNLGGPIDITRTPYCGGTISATECSMGRPGLRSLMAIDYLKYGTSSDDNPQYGDIVVLERHDRSGNRIGNHVAYYAGAEDSGRIRILGGNQNYGAITLQTAPRSEILGFRRPPYEKAVNFNPCLSRR